MASVIIGDYEYTSLGNTARASVVDKTKTTYDEILSSVTISGTTYPVTSLYHCFKGCTSLETAPTIPNSVDYMNDCFVDCTSLETAPTIPNGVTHLEYCFSNCTSLETAPTIPNSATRLTSCFSNCTSLETAPTIPNSVSTMASCFSNCTSLETAPTIPNSVTNLQYCFSNCTSLETAPTIPNSATNLDGCFSGCTSLTGEVIINANSDGLKIFRTFYRTQKGIWLTGSCTRLAEIAATATNNNVFVGEIPLSYSLDIERVAGDGGTVQDPEGLCAHVQLTINWTDLTDNSIDAITLINGTASTSPTWYTDAAKTSTIALPNWRPSASTTIHCWLAITSATHVFSVTVADHYHTGVVISFTVPQQFRTMDFLAGGQGVAFGMPATQVGMFINMALALKQANGIIANIYDVFYPVGSYYETSDSNFDPNAVWGGTWVLETSGLVHVSGNTGDANYPVSGTFTDANSGKGQKQDGNKDAIIPYHRHNVAEKATGGPSNNTSGGQSQGHTHSPSNATNFMYYDSDVSGANVGRRNIGSGSGSYYTWTAAKTDALKASAATSGASQGHTHSLQNHTHTLGQHYTDYEGTNGNRTNANMQPYINIYRWHRTA